MGFATGLKIKPTTPEFSPTTAMVRIRMPEATAFSRNWVMEHQIPEYIINIMVSRLPLLTMEKVLQFFCRTWAEIERTKTKKKKRDLRLPEKRGRENNI